MHPCMMTTICGGWAWMVLRHLFSFWLVMDEEGGDPKIGGQGQQQCRRRRADFAALL